MTRAAFDLPRTGSLETKGQQLVEPPPDSNLAASDASYFLQPCIRDAFGPWTLDFTLMVKTGRCCFFSLSFSFIANSWT
jgi:hypothetical protein